MERFGVTLVPDKIPNKQQGLGAATQGQTLPSHNHKPSSLLPLGLYNLTDIKHNVKQKAAKRLWFLVNQGNDYSQKIRDAFF